MQKANITLAVKTTVYAIRENLSNMFYVGRSRHKGVADYNLIWAHTDTHAKTWRRLSDAKRAALAASKNYYALNADPSTGHICGTRINDVLRIVELTRVTETTVGSSFQVAKPDSLYPL